MPVFTEKEWKHLKWWAAIFFGAFVLLVAYATFDLYVLMDEEERQAFLQEADEQEAYLQRLEERRKREAAERDVEEERRAAEQKQLEEDLMSAWARCQGFAEGRLVSPASAEWPWDNRPYTSHLGSGRFRVRTHVDSQNRFGAMLRTPVDCVVQKTGAGWRLESLDME